MCRMTYQLFAVQCRWYNTNYLYIWKGHLYNLIEIIIYYNIIIQCIECIDGSIRWHIMYILYAYQNEKRVAPKS